jgi:hypothetical protein
VPYAEVPKLLGAAAVGLLPFTSSARNQGRSPMKYYEYLASGLWVLGSHTPTLEKRSSPGVALYRSKHEAVDSLRSYLDKSRRNTEGVDHARSFGWGDRARVLEEFLLTIVR